MASTQSKFTIRIAALSICSLALATAASPAFAGSPNITLGADRLTTDRILPLLPGEPNKNGTDPREFAHVDIPEIGQRPDEGGIGGLQWTPPEKAFEFGEPGSFRDFDHGFGSISVEPVGIVPGAVPTPGVVSLLTLAAAAGLRRRR